MKIKSYRDLFVWQKGFELTLSVYRLTENFSKNELFGLISQSRRASVSVISNIAEGYSRKSEGDLLRFLRIAMGSASELEAQLMVAKELGFADREKFTATEKLLASTLKLMQCFIKKLKVDNLRTRQLNGSTARQLKHL